MDESSILITPDLVRHYHQTGYVLLPAALNATDLALLREECDALVNHCSLENDLVTQLGCVIEPMSSGLVEIEPEDVRAVRIHRPTFSRLRGEIYDNAIPNLLLKRIGPVAAAFLPEANDMDTGPYLLNEQYIVKPPYSGGATQFAWHQDNQYLPEPFRDEPTVACWIALDDVDLNNGTVVLEPYPAAPGIPSESLNVSQYIQHHVAAAATYPCLADSPPPSNLNLTTPSPRYRVATMSAGSLLIMSGHFRHASPPSYGRTLRRAWMPQFSARPFGRQPLLPETKDHEGDGIDNDEPLVAWAVGIS